MVTHFSGGSEAWRWERTCSCGRRWDRGRASAGAHLLSPGRQGLGSHLPGASEGAWGQQGLRYLEPAGEWPGGEAWRGSRGRGSESGGRKRWAWGVTGSLTAQRVPCDAFCSGLLGQEGWADPRACLRGR